MNTTRVRVKMCGMTRNTDIEHAVRLGVDAIGLIFYPQSARYIRREQAKNLLKNIPPFVTVVAVLVNPDSATVHQLIDELRIDLLQFHGDESPKFCEQFKKPFIKSIYADSTEHIQQAMNDFVSARALLLDTPSDKVRGGTGLVFDWSIIPQKKTMPYIVAGGLTEINVLDAIKSSYPYAVDLCSGIEVSPGIKDHEKMSRFMKQLNKINSKVYA